MHKRHTISILPLALVAGLTGCSDTETAKMAIGADANTGTEKDAANNADASQVDTLPNLTGLWALREITATDSEIPFIGVTTSFTHTLVLMNVQSTGETSYSVQETVCGLTMDSGTQFATNSVKASYISTRPIRTRDISVTAPATFVRVPDLVIEGVQLAVPESDILPSDMIDPRLVDEDQDGQPGFTVNVNVTVGLPINAELYVVQRSKIGLAGTIESENRIAGNLAIERFESVVVGASNSLLIPDKAPVAVPDESNFVMVRMPAETTCLEILSADEAELFGN